MQTVRFEPEWLEKATKKRSIHVVCEHFEEFFQAILAKDGHFLNCAEQLQIWQEINLVNFGSIFSTT